MSPKNKGFTREVSCPDCDTINLVSFNDIGGIRTIFCKKCGEQMRLVFERTVMGLELKGKKIK